MENIENVPPTNHRILRERKGVFGNQKENVGTKQVLQAKNKEGSKKDYQPLKEIQNDKNLGAGSLFYSMAPKSFTVFADDECANVEAPFKGAFSVFEANQETKRTAERCAVSVFEDEIETAKEASSKPAFSVFSDEIKEEERSQDKTENEPSSGDSSILSQLENTNIEDKENCSGDVSMISQPLSPMVVEQQQQNTIQVTIPSKLNFTDDPLCPKEYQKDIYIYLREIEQRNRPRPMYMRRQQDITLEMRSILVDWLVEVAEEYRLESETLFLTVHYVDRFLSYMSVDRSKLQLVGAAAMFIAGKFEEIYPPDVGEFVYITDDTYTKKQMLRMEHLVLKVLSFDLAAPTPQRFLSLYTQQSELDVVTFNLALYLCELTLLHCDPFLFYLPSVIAASAILIANVTLGRESWSAELCEVTQYKISDLTDCCKHMHLCFIKADKFTQQATRDKYKSPKRQSVSLLTPPDTLSWLLVPTEQEKNKSQDTNTDENDM